MFSVPRERPIPSLATTKSTTYGHPSSPFCSILFQKNPQLGSPEFVSTLFGTASQDRNLTPADRWLGSSQEPENFNSLLGNAKECWLPRAVGTLPNSLETSTAIYIRCSTAGIKKYDSVPAPMQNPEVQLEPLKELIQQRGWNLFRVYSDRMSGAKQARPGLEALMGDARRGKFQVVLVWRFDRFARSVKQLVLALVEFRSLGIDFVSHQEALDTSTPMGKAMFTIIAAITELERDYPGARHGWPRTRQEARHEVGATNRQTQTDFRSRKGSPTSSGVEASEVSRGNSA